MPARATQADVTTFGELVVALREAASSPREAAAALDHLLRTQRVSFERPRAAQRLRRALSAGV